MDEIKPGILKPLSSKIPRYDIYGFDIETTGSDNEFLMGSVIGKDHKAVFWDREEMIAHFLNTRRYYYNARIFATNLYFDFSQLFPRKNENWKRADKLMRGTRMLQVRLHNENTENRRLIFLDTLNYAQMSVKNLGKIIGIEKMETPDYIIEEREPREDEYPYIEKYNLNDSEITYTYASFLQESFIKMGCKLRLTVASTAMDLFKRKYLEKRIFQEPASVMEQAFKSYYGGRTEVFQRGCVKNCNYYDFNSLYPSVMRNEYPDVSKSRYLERGSESVINCYHGISEVVIECPSDMHIPLLPYKYDDRLAFETGIIHGAYSNIELREAIKLGYRIIDVGWQIYYTKTHYPFRKYVDDLYAIRKEKKAKGDASQEVVKLLMNALYGKFGQKIKGKERILNMDDLNHAEIVRLSKKGRLTIEDDIAFYIEDNPSHMASHILPAYAIYTSAYGRLKLHRAIRDINVVYIDTDSIVTPEDLPTSDKLGELKLEHRIKEGVFIRPKMYGFRNDEGKDIIKMKGNPSAKSWTYEEFLSFLKSPTQKTKRFSTFKTSIRKGIGFNTIIEMERTFGLEDNKRLWERTFNPTELQSSRPRISSSVVSQDSDVSGSIN